MNRFSNNSGPSLFGIIIAIAVLSLFGGVLANLAIIAVATIPLIIAIGFVVFMVAAIFGGNKNKAKADLTQDLIKVLNKINLDNNRIIIDDESYLLLTDLSNITLDTIDIYMNNEYAGTLSEFSNTYPNAYNNLCSKLIKANKKLKKKKNKDNQDIIIEPIKEVIQEKGCAYYIKKFHELNSEIKTDSVKQSINETITYLEDIKKIEDEFGDSKNKTRKLYEYYLPMYVDILANYDRLYNTAKSSEEFKDNELKLTKTSELINSALKSISSSLTESYYTDLNVNMKTLESILKKDGLVQENMETK